MSFGSSELLSANLLKPWGSQYDGQLFECWNEGFVAQVPVYGSCVVRHDDIREMGCFCDLDVAIE